MSHAGFPIDLTQLIANENHKAIDMDAVERLMDEEREKSRAHAFSVSSSTVSSSIKLGEGGVPSAIQAWMKDGRYYPSRLLPSLSDKAIDLSPEFTGYLNQSEEETSIVALLPDIQVSQAG